jgi:hypothetical protein
MFPALLVGQTAWYSTRCKLIWKLRSAKVKRVDPLSGKVTWSRRLYFQLQVPVRRTFDTEFGLLDMPGTMIKTPTKMDGHVTSGKKKPVSGDSGTLAQEIMSGYGPTLEKLGMLPTPNTRDRGKRSQQGMESRKEKRGYLDLSDLIRATMLPTELAAAKSGVTKTKTKKEGAADLQTYIHQAATAMQRSMVSTPTAQDGKNSTLPRSQANKKDGIISGLLQMDSTIGDHFHLNPLFVAEMMGFPLSWTLMPFLDPERVAIGSSGQQPGGEGKV